jgi:hypothetical protein
VQKNGHQSPEEAIDDHFWHAFLLLKSNENTQFTNF